MDENEFRKTYDALRELPCAFEKAILNRRAGCSKVRRIHLGEREGVTCTEWRAQHACGALIDEVRQNARFALHMTGVHGPLPHAKEIKVQVGGLKGLYQALYESEAPAVLPDVHALVTLARARYAEPSSLPLQAIIKAVTAFSGRRRRSRRGDD